MNGSHVVAASGVTSALAAVIVWVSACLEKGQLLQVNTETSVAMATLLVTLLGGGSIMAWGNKAKPPETPPAPPTPTPEK